MKTLEQAITNLMLFSQHYNSTGEPPDGFGMYLHVRDVAEAAGRLDEFHAMRGTRFGTVPPVVAQDKPTI